MTRYPPRSKKIYARPSPTHRKFLPTLKTAQLYFARDTHAPLRDRAQRLASKFQAAASPAAPTARVRGREKKRGGLPTRSQSQEHRLGSTSIIAPQSSAGPAKAVPPAPTSWLTAARVVARRRGARDAGDLACSGRWWRGGGHGQDPGTACFRPVSPFPFFLEISFRQLDVRR